MKILKLTEQEDGSAIADCEFTKGEIDFFVEYAVIDIIKKQIKREEEMHEQRTNGDKEI